MLLGFPCQWELGLVVGGGVVAGGVLKLALPDLAALIVMLQEPVPEQLPPQPEKVEPAAGVAVRFTTVPLVNVWVQSPGQLIPVPVTEPLPAAETVSV